LVGTRRQSPLSLLPLDGRGCQSPDPVDGQGNHYPGPRFSIGRRMPSIKGTKDPIGWRVPSSIPFPAPTYWSACGANHPRGPPIGRAQPSFSRHDALIGRRGTPSPLGSNRRRLSRPPPPLGGNRCHSSLPLAGRPINHLNLFLTLPPHWLLGAVYPRPPQLHTDWTRHLSPTHPPPRGKQGEFLENSLVRMRPRARSAPSLRPALIGRLPWPNGFSHWSSRQSIND